MLNNYIISRQNIGDRTMVMEVPKFDVHSKAGYVDPFDRNCKND